MKFVALAGALGLTLSATAANAAVSITFAGGSAGPAAGTSVYEDFNEFAVGTSIGSGAKILAPPSSGEGATPASGDGTNYLSVLGGAGYTTSFAASSVFSFVIGSLDAYNSIDLMFEGGGSQSYTGAEIAALATGSPIAVASGNQASNTSNGVLTFTSSGPKFTGAAFASSQNSMEVDNLAVSAAPELATWAMMIIGVGAVGLGLRRRQQPKVSFGF